MARRVQSLLLRIALCGSVGIAAISFARCAKAESPTSQPSLLQRLSDDTQRLYVQARHSIVRVQLPTPQWLEQFNDRQEFLRKWGPVMDPAVRQKIMEEQDRAMSDLHHAPATLPTTTPSAFATSQPTLSEIHVAQMNHPGEANLGLYAVGMLVDDQGHAVFPVFVDRKYVGGSALAALTGDGQTTTARFVGSDEKTNLTVLQLEDHAGTPAPLGHIRPQDGVLTLAIASDGGAKLIVWSNQHPEPGFAVLPDGAVAGFGFGGYFLGASTAKPIVDQLIATGEVHRAVLGVLTAEVTRDDPIRRQRPELGTIPALMIRAVQDGSAAARGGMHPDDLILTIGDQAVGDVATFAAVIAVRRGDTTLRVLRGKTIIELTVNLQAK